MASVDAGQFGTAAHEYAHSVLRAAGLRFPPWFGEGLAEFFSTLHIGEGGCTLGGDLPARSQFLQRHAWMPLPDLLALPADSSIHENRDTAGMFYAESWALADMLVLSPDYGPRFNSLIAALVSRYAKLRSPSNGLWEILRRHHARPSRLDRKTPPAGRPARHSSGTSLHPTAAGSLAFRSPRADGRDLASLGRSDPLRAHLP